MKVEKLLSDGGIGVTGNLRDGEPFSIMRLSSEGETRVSYPGLDLDYDTAGRLILAVIRLVEFAGSQPAEYLAKLPAAFWETVSVLTKGGVEVAAEVDFQKGVVEVVSLDRFGRNVLTQFSLEYYDGVLMPVMVGDEDGLAGKVGFQVGAGRERSLVTLGVGSAERVMWVAVPLLVAVELLSGKIDVAGVDAFLKGKLKGDK